MPAPRHQHDCQPVRRDLALLLALTLLAGFWLPACAATPAALPPASTTTGPVATAVATPAPTTGPASATLPTTPTLALSPSPRSTRPAATPAPGAATTPLACAPGVDFLGFSDALDKTQFAETTVGGLSGLVYDARRDVYYSVVDNERATPARVYTLRLPLDGARLGTPEVLAVTVLRDAAGQPFTGRNFDGEAIALLPNGDLLVASETEPAIWRFTPDGQLRAELPAPARFLVAPRGEARANSTFESLGLSPDGQTLFTAVEGPLTSDGFTGDGRGRLRLLRYAARAGIDFAPVAQHFYLTEPGQGVSEVAVLSSHELIVLERGFVPLRGNTVRLFRVALDGASDVSPESSLAAPGLVPLRKELLVDLGQCPASGARHPAPQANPLLDNIESVALGPVLPDGRRALLLQSDDNFSSAQVTRVIALALGP